MRNFWRSGASGRVFALNSYQNQINKCGELTMLSCNAWISSNILLNVWLLYSNQTHIIIAVYMSMALFWLYTGDTQEDAGCGQHVRAVEHSDETDRKTSHPRQVHHDWRHAGDLCLYVPGNQIPGLTTIHPKRGFSISRGHLCSASSLTIWKVAELSFFSIRFRSFLQMVPLKFVFHQCNYPGHLQNDSVDEDLKCIQYLFPLEAPRER